VLFRFFALTVTAAILHGGGNGRFLRRFFGVVEAATAADVVAVAVADDVGVGVSAVSCRILWVSVNEGAM
jgi:hypothetical protein